MPFCTALVVAAGHGVRAGGEKPKQYRDLLGAPLLRRGIDALSAHAGIGRIQVVIDPQHRMAYDAAVAGLDLPPPVAGGASRQESVRLGLEHLAKASPPDWVLIHDAARPLVGRPTLDRVLAALAHGPAAVPALPVADTLKRGENGRIAATIPRDGLFQAQTPQGFHFDAILKAHRAAAGLDLTDDAAVAEHAGLAVALVAGERHNIKITAPEDFDLAARLLGGNPMETRTGSGFDVHRFGPGDHVMLCGVRVPHDHGLVGHSDADVGLHALTDAVLGAIAAQDIGAHFPPSDLRWKGANSSQFLRHAASLVAARGGTILSLDVTVIAEQPKVSPHRDAMRAAIAAILGLDIERVSVKATTTEGLGFTGRGEGIAAQALATVATPRHLR
ncbi:MAG: bifunctional 2-C-methyl-D-erythritol 4-phosphate cytidylyltransferase/2-C-methyl-D-erythritol 2,4-cyclodiphosphate synthase [Alphaproteobacteria bacterium]